MRNFSISEKEIAFSIAEAHLWKNKKEWSKEDQELATFQNAECEVKKFLKIMEKDNVSFEVEGMKAGSNSQKNIQKDIQESRNRIPENGSFRKRKENKSHMIDHAKPNMPTNPEHIEIATVKHAILVSEINQVMNETRISTDPDCSEAATDDRLSPEPSTSSDSSFVQTSVKVQGHSMTSNKKMPYNRKVNKTFNCSQFEKHLRTNSQAKRFVCETCNKSFSRREHLRRHIGSHTGQTPFVCGTCNKGFHRSDSLITHIRSHTGEKLYACETCNKRFKSSGELRKHIRSHTGEKPFVCEFCNKQFATIRNLRVHIRTHTGEKSYVCETCNKRFKSSGELRKHIRSHTGEKPYVCEFCNKRFSTSSYLRVHVRLHTGEKPYICESCDKSFSRISEKKRHESTHKRTNINE